MITKLKSLKELPYDIYTAVLLKSEDEAKEGGYIYISNSPKMILLFIPFVEEIYVKTS